jgi:hypothetical protein
MHNNKQLGINHLKARSSRGGVIVGQTGVGVFDYLTGQAAFVDRAEFSIWARRRTQAMHLLRIDMIEVWP